MECNKDAIIAMVKMTHLEQYVNKVLDYTQRYNNSNSSYYAPSNLIGKPEMYPLFGDVPETYALVSKKYLLRKLKVWLIHCFFIICCY